MNKQPISAVRSNIWKLYAIQACTQALFAIPIIVLFWRSHGLDFRQMMLLQSGFAMTILILEIPTGYLADRWGRKKTIVTGCFLGFLGFLIYASGTNFWHFLLAEMIIGIGVSMGSGASEAIMYDTLSASGEERMYRRTMGNQTFFEFSAEALSSLAGGALALFSLVLPLWITTIPMAASVLIALSLHEPKRHVLRETRHWKRIWDVSLDTLFRHRELRSIIFLHGVISTMTLTFFWFFQPYQKIVGVPLAFFGITHAIIVIAGALASKYVSTLEKRIDDRLLLMAIAAAVVFCFLILGMPPVAWGLLLFLVSRTAWGFLGPLTSDMTNRMAASDVRATVMSVRSFFGRAIFVCTSPFVGMMADARSIPFALLTTGLIGGAVLLVVFTVMRSVWRNIPA